MVFNISLNHHYCLPEHRCHWVSDMVKGEGKEYRPDSSQSEGVGGCAYLHHYSDREYK
jgi:hypothetical protein